MSFTEMPALESFISPAGPMPITAGVGIFFPQHFIDFVHALAHQWSGILEFHAVLVDRQGCTICLLAGVPSTMMAASPSLAIFWLDRPPALDFLDPAGQRAFGAKRSAPAAGRSRRARYPTRRNRPVCCSAPVGGRSRIDLVTDDGGGQTTTGEFLPFFRHWLVAVARFVMSIRRICLVIICSFSGFLKRETFYLRFVFVNMVHCAMYLHCFVRLGDILIPSRYW